MQLQADSALMNAPGARTDAERLLSSAEGFASIADAAVAGAGPHAFAGSHTAVLFFMLAQAAEIAEEDEGPLMQPDEAAPYLRRAFEAGAIEAAERDLLAAILAGKPLSEALGANLAIRRRIKTEFDGDVADFVEDLSARTAKFVIEAETRP